MATEDKRHLDNRFPMARYEFATQTYPMTAADALSPTLNDVCGTIMAIEIIISDTQDGITYTVAITTENSATLFLEATMIDNTKHWRDAESDKNPRDADFNSIPVNGALTATITPIVAPDNASVGTKTATVQVILYIK